MARPRAFHRDQALQRAIEVFCAQGFAAATTDELLEAMGISRQSMYNTFGDKRQLYLEALRSYQAASINELIQRLNQAASPLAGLEEALLAFAARAEREGAAGCMGVNATCEFGRTDPEITMLLETSGSTLLAALERALGAAKASRQIDPGLDERAAAHFLLSTPSGMKVSAKAGASPDALRETARLALRGLRPPAPDHARGRSDDR